MPSRRPFSQKNAVPKARSHPKGGITKELKRLPAQEIFARLLYTWPLQVERWLDKKLGAKFRKLAIQHKGTHYDWARRDLQLDIESQHGDGHYEDRKILLEVCIQFLQWEKGFHLSVLFEILRKARSDAAAASRRRASFSRIGMSGLTRNINSGVSSSQPSRPIGSNESRGTSAVDQSSS